MPFLSIVRSPEVETFKRYLDKTSLKQLITGIQVTDNRILNTDENYLRESLKGKKFESSTRHGKYLLVDLKPRYLVLHFGMSGDLKYFDKNEAPPKFSKVIFQFNNSFNLAYISIRMFGKVAIANSIDEFIEDMIWTVLEKTAKNDPGRFTRYNYASSFVMSTSVIFEYGLQTKYPCYSPIPKSLQFNGWKY
mgnify:CR=1 FL=1